MVPAIRRDELHDVGNMVANECLQKTSVSIQQTEDNSTASPREHTLSRDAQC